MGRVRKVFGSLSGDIGDKLDGIGGACAGTTAICDRGATVQAIKSTKSPKCPTPQADRHRSLAVLRTAIHLYYKFHYIVNRNRCGPRGTAEDLGPTPRAAAGCPRSLARPA